MRRRWSLVWVVAVLVSASGAAARGDAVLEDYLALKRSYIAPAGDGTADKVLLDLIIDPAGAGTWEVRAVVVGEDDGPPVTAGLGDFTLDVFGDGGAVVTSSHCRAIRFEPADAPGATAGFYAIRDDGELGMGMMAVQYTFYAPDGQNDPALDRLVIQGAGILDGADMSTSGPVGWEEAFLVASGTYEGQGWLTAENTADDVGWFLLPDRGGPVGLGWYGPTNDLKPWATQVVSDSEYVVPEPTALLLLAGGALAMLRRRR